VSHSVFANTLDNEKILERIHTSIKQKDLLCYDNSSGIKYYASNLLGLLESEQLEIEFNSDTSTVTINRKFTNNIITLIIKTNSDISIVEEIIFTDVSFPDGHLLRKVSCF